MTDCLCETMVFCIIAFNDTPCFNSSIDSYFTSNLHTVIPGILRAIESSASNNAGASEISLPLNQMELGRKPVLRVLRVSLALLVKAVNRPIFGLFTPITSKTRKTCFTCFTGFLPSSRRSAKREIYMRCVVCVGI